MSPEARFHTTVLSVTVSFMFAALVFLQPQLQLLHGSGPIGNIVGWLISLVASVATYHTVSKGLLLILSRLGIVKKWILGPLYLQGTWVGYYIEPGGETRLIVEIHEQDLESLVIRGSSYSINGDTCATWTSQTTDIDAKSGTLMYSYTCDLYAKTVSHQGVAVFRFQRKRASAPPHAIDGYSADLTNGIRTPSKEKKVCDTQLDVHDAIEKAKEFAMTAIPIAPVTRAPVSV